LKQKCSICELSQDELLLLTSPSPSSQDSNLITSTIPSTSSTAAPSLINSNNDLLDHKYKNGHVCIQCNYKSGCKLWFHVTCAQMNGLLCEQLSPPTSNSLIYSVYCKNHLNKSVRK